jgi:hypothetical protein
MCFLFVFNEKQQMLRWAQHDRYPFSAASQEREARRNKPNEAKRFDIKRIRGKGEKQTQCCYPKSNQYFTGISGPFLKKYE